MTEDYKIRTVLSTADFIDIGTPESLLEAESCKKSYSFLDLRSINECRICSS